MDVVVILVFISLVLVAGAVAFFVSRLRGGDFDHGARLSLLPLADDTGRSDDDTVLADDTGRSDDDTGGPADVPATTEKGPVHGSR